MKEEVLSLELEKQISKDDILSLYLNGNFITAAIPTASRKRVRNFLAQAPAGVTLSQER